jgi:adenylosuccinate synthase
MKSKPFMFMKNLFLLLCFLCCVGAAAQNKKQAIIEKRARELHRVMGLNDKEQWKKFMTDNYSKAMLERRVLSNVETTEKEHADPTTTETTDKLEEKAKVFERLHRNFGDSKIKSLKTFDERIEMILESSSGLKGDFNITFESEAPYLINRIAVEINDR